MDDGRVRVLFCASCGAPLDARAWDAFVLCRFCSANNAVGAPAASSVLDDGRPRVNVAGRTYIVDGRLARGERCDVFRGRWAMRLGELVVLKVNRAPADGSRVRQAYAVAEALHAAADASSAGLAGRVPRPIGLGVDRRVGEERVVAVYQWKSGFQDDLQAVKRAWPSGVDGRIGVWLLRRQLELLGFVHQCGWTHGAVRPEHVLVHPRDHGATLVGWSSSVRGGDRRADLAAAAKTTLAVTASFAAPVAERVDELAAGRGSDDAWTALEALRDASRAAYGPSSYNPLPMPGW